MRLKTRNSLVLLSSDASSLLAFDPFPYVLLSLSSSPFLLFVCFCIHYDSLIASPVTLLSASSPIILDGLYLV
jgi:hypothetical protein